MKRLIEKLLNSLHPSQSEIDELWATEAERRVDQIKSGQVDAISGDEVFEHIRKRLQK